MIFPLPFVAFEHYLMADERPSHPMVCHFRFCFDGELDREILERSVDAATARHPLFRAVVQRKGRSLQFVPAGQRRPEFIWETDPDRDVLENFEPLDMFNEVGLRVTVCQGAGRATMWMAMHHVCSDGMGAMRFIEDLFTCYANEVADTPIPLPALDERQLLDRGVFASSRLRQWLRWPWEMLCVLGSVEYFSHRPLALQANGGAPRVDKSQAAIALCHRCLDADVTRQLLKAAREQQVTANDLMLRDLFLSAQDWLEANAESSEEVKGHVRIMVPVNLRTRLHDAMPAANSVGMINIERRVYRWTDPRKMLRVLAKEMRIVKRLRVTTTMLRIVSLVRLLTGSLRWLQPVDRCLSTCVLSNMAIMFYKSPLADDEGRVKLGDVTMREFQAVPPIRPWTGAGFCVYSYARKLTLCLLYDKELLGPEGGEDLVERFAKRLTETAQGERRIEASSDLAPGGDTRSSSAAAGEPVT